jgi:hypothetical protein
MSNDITEKDTFTFVPRNLEDAMKLAELLANSDLVPKAFQDKPGDILVCVQKGAEIGLSPMSALESIAVVNGRATLYGDALLALVQASPHFEFIDENQSTEKVGVCIAKRKGSPAVTSTFTLDDAKRAGLLGKPGPWTQYTARMLKLRARGFALRDAFADALKGMSMREDVQDTTVSVQGPDAPALPPPSLKEKLQAQLAPPAAEELPPPPKLDLRLNENGAERERQAKLSDPVPDLYPTPEQRAATVSGLSAPMSDSQWESWHKEAVKYPTVFVAAKDALTIAHDHRPLNRAIRSRFRVAFEQIAKEQKVKLWTDK